MSTPVHIEYCRSGGLAGIAMTASVDSRDLPAAEGQLAADLLTSGPAAEDEHTPGIPDGFSYEVTLTDGTRTRTYHWQDPHVPDTVRPLLAALTERAQPAPAR
jgi:hypothetical protein